MEHLHLSPPGGADRWKVSIYSMFGGGRVLSEGQENQNKLSGST
jgi:hypothetical protein